MSQKKNNTENNNPLRKFFSRFNPRYFNFDQKLRTVLIFITLFSIFVIASVVFYFSKLEARQNAFNHVSAIQESKSQYLEDYFNLLTRQLSTLSSDELVVNSMIEFKRTFHDIEYDSYLTTEGNSLIAIDQKLQSYYQTEFAQVLNVNLDSDFKLESLYPKDVKTKILQFLYIARNGYDFEKKHLLNKASDQSMYSYAHSDYHPKLRRLASDFGFDDIYLIDDITGHVVYSLKKDFVFGMDLMTGRYKNINLARLFKEATVGSEEFVKKSDYEIHLPSLGEPAMFIASPIYSNGQKLGVLACKIPNKRIHNIITSDNNWEMEGLGKTGQVYLVGEDLKLRSRNRYIIDRKSTYLQQLQEAGYTQHDINMIDNLNTNILLHDAELRVINEALKGKKSKAIERDYRGEQVIATAQPLRIKDLNWAIAGQMDLDETYSSFRRLRNIIGIASLVFLVLSLFLGHKIAQGFSTRIILIRDALRSLSRGESVKKIKDHNNDEISQTVSALQTLSERIDYASEFAQSIGSGNFNAFFEIQSDNDKFGQSLTQMKDSLVTAKEEEKKRQQEDEIRNWITNGIAKFSELLRKDNEDIEKLSYNVVKEMVHYVEANIGGMYLLNDDDPNNHFYELKAAFAYDRKKYLNIKFAVSEGLVGTCAAEKETIFLKEIPENYIDITSGFGHSNPRSMMLVPLRVEEIVYGVIEIGALEVFKEHHIEFIERLAESIAATLVTVRLNVKTQKLLKESEERSNEIKQQEEEMRQNLEEMVATQEELERVRKDEERKIAELNRSVQSAEALVNGIMNKVPGSMVIKDFDGQILFANEQAATEAYTTVKELVGKTGLEAMKIEEADKIIESEQQLIKDDRDDIVDDIKGDKKDKRYVRIIKGPVPIDVDGNKGLFVWEMEYNEFRKYGEEDIRQELKEFKLKLKDTMKDLKNYKDKYGDL